MADMNVLRDWLSDLTLRQQTVLLAAVRGPDGVDKNDISRQLVRALRAVVLRDAAPGNGFMQASLPAQVQLHDQFLKRVDAYPLHWLVHFMHAAEVVAYEHPDRYEAEPWGSLYYGLSEALHVNPESEEQMRASPPGRGRPRVLEVMILGALIVVAFLLLCVYLARRAP